MKLCGENINKIYQGFKYNVKAFTHYRIIGQDSDDICYNIFVANKSFGLFWNIFNTKAIKVCHTVTIDI